MNASEHNVALDAVEIAGLGIALYVATVASGVALWSAIDAVRRHRATVHLPAPSLLVHSDNVRMTATAPASLVNLRDAA
jgi:hypothetical protein